MLSQQVVVAGKNPKVRIDVNLGTMPVEDMEACLAVVQKSSQNGLAGEHMEYLKDELVKYQFDKVKMTLKGHAYSPKYVANTQSSFTIFSPSTNLCFMKCIWAISENDFGYGHIEEGEQRDTLHLVAAQFEGFKRLYQEQLRLSRSSGEAVNGHHYSMIEFFASKAGIAVVSYEQWINILSDVKVENLPKKALNCNGVEVPLFPCLIIGMQGNWNTGEHCCIAISDCNQKPLKMTQVLGILDDFNSFGVGPMIQVVNRATIQEQKRANKRISSQPSANKTNIKRNFVYQKQDASGKDDANWNSKDRKNHNVINSKIRYAGKANQADFDDLPWSSKNDNKVAKFCMQLQNGQLEVGAVPPAIRSQQAKLWYASTQKARNGRFFQNVGKHTVTKYEMRYDPKDLAANCAKISKKKKSKPTGIIAGPVEMTCYLVVAVIKMGTIIYLDRKKPRTNRHCEQCLDQEVQCENCKIVKSTMLVGVSEIRDIDPQAKLIANAGCSLIAAIHAHRQRDSYVKEDEAMDHRKQIVTKMTQHAGRVQSKRTAIIPGGRLTADMKTLMLQFGLAVEGTILDMSHQSNGGHIFHRHMSDMLHYDQQDRLTQKALESS